MTGRPRRTLLATLLLAVALTTAGCTGVLPADESQAEALGGANTTTDGPNATDATTAAATANAEERAKLTFVAENGTRLANVSAMVSNTPDERYTGLSDTESLGPNEGMLFVYDEEGHHAYVMRKMDFPLDIIYVGSDGEITKIHHAPLPPADRDRLKRYEGTGQYVVEVNHHFTDRHNITEGDTVRIER